MSKISIAIIALAAFDGTAVAQSLATPTGNPGTWYNADNYPPEAIRADEQGRTVVVLDVDATGAITKCTVKVSSKSAALDAATCKIALTDGHYAPARNRKGLAVASKAILPVKWVLPTVKMVPMSAATFSTMSRVEIAADGTVVSCQDVMVAKGPSIGFGGPCDPRATDLRSMILTSSALPTGRKLVTMQFGLLIGDDQGILDPGTMNTDIRSVMFFQMKIQPDGAVRDCTITEVIRQNGVQSCDMLFGRLPALTAGKPPRLRNATGMISIGVEALP